MNNETAPPPALLDQLIATLLAFFGVPLAFARRVLDAHVRVRRRFAALLQACKRLKVALRYEGEDDAIVQARVDLLAWVADNPRKAFKHLARQVRGWRAFRWMRFGLVPQPVARVMGCALTDAFGFDALVVDTS